MKRTDKNSIIKLYATISQRGNILEKNTKKQEKWRKKHHAITFGFLKCVFKPFFRLRYRLKPNKDEKIVPQGALIMSNHQTTYDQFIVMCSFKRPIYLIASEDLFLNPVLGPLMKYTMSPISKSKSKSDLMTIKNTLKVLKEGNTIALFPEGNRTLSGGSWHIDFSTAKLAKIAKAPLVLYRIDGGYGTDPRWGGKIRRGKMKAGTVKVIEAEQLANMSLEEIYSEIVNTLRSNDYEQGVKFKSRRRAEFLERALYYCPNCKSFETLFSKGNYLYCKNCEMVAEYSEDLKIKALAGAVPYDNVYEWFDAQQLALKAADDIKLKDTNLKLKLICGKKCKNIGMGDITCDKNRVKIDAYSGTVYDYSFSELDGATVLGKRKINFYLPDGNTLQVEGDKRFCAIKYLHLFENSKEKINE